MFWLFWVYLWVPILALLAWALGVQQAVKYMVVLGGYHDVIRLLGLYSMIILLLGTCLLFWAAYNIIRFRGVERRTFALPVTPATIGSDSGHDPKLIARWQSEQRLYVTHDKQGKIAQVEIL